MKTRFTLPGSSSGRYVVGTCVTMICGRWFQVTEVRQLVYGWVQVHGEYI